MDERNTYKATEIRLFDEWKYIHGWLIYDKVQGLMRYSKKGEMSLTFDQLFERFLLETNLAKYKQYQ